MSECPDWGPAEGHHFYSEDTDDYVGICTCGADDPALRVSQRGVPLRPGDEPPF